MAHQRAGEAFLAPIEIEQQKQKAIVQQALERMIPTLGELRRDQAEAAAAAAARAR